MCLAIEEGENHQGAMSGVERAPGLVLFEPINSQPSPRPLPPPLPPHPSSGHHVLSDVNQNHVRPTICLLGSLTHTPMADGKSQCLELECSWVRGELFSNHGNWKYTDFAGIEME